MSTNGAGNPSLVVILLLLALYLSIGRFLYNRRWPSGLFPRHIDPERERWRRQRRTRVPEYEDDERA